MDNDKSPVYQDRFSTVETEWPRSKGNFRRYSVEYLTETLPYSTSAASSGYWEDCDSLWTSAHEINQGSQCQSLERTNSDFVKPADFKISSNNQKPYFPNNFGSFDEDDRPLSPKSVTIKIPGPQIKLNASTEVLQTQGHTTLNFNKEQIERSGLITNESHLFRKCSDPTRTTCSSFHHLYTSNEVGMERVNPRITILQRRGTLCSSADSSDSDNEENACESPVDQPEPRTLFEAALRRARLADSQREINYTSGNTTGRSMPDWGSPIRHHQPNVNLPSSVGHSSKPDEDNPSEKNLVNCGKSRDQPLPSVDKQQLNGGEVSDVPCHSGDRDLCTGIETWLSGRPRWLYQVGAIDKNTLQLCYLSDSDVEMWTSNEFDRSSVDELSSCEADREIIRNSKPEVDCSNTDERGFDSKMPLDEKSCTRHVNGGKLFQDYKTLEEINSRLGMMDQYCELYFKQMAQECVHGDARIELKQLQEKHRATQNDVQFSLLQATKIARVQLELERPVWSVISPHMAEMLRIKQKHRTVLPQSILATLSSTHLRLVFNNVCSVIEDLNKCLVESLMERDELNLEHGAKLIALDDLIAYFKELCIRVSNRQYRRQIMAHEAAVVNIKCDFSTNPTQINKSCSISDSLGKKQQSNNQDWQRNKPSTLSLKQRLLSAFSRRNEPIY